MPWAVIYIGRENTNIEGRRCISNTILILKMNWNRKDDMKYCHSRSLQRTQRKIMLPRTSAENMNINKILIFFTSVFLAWYCVTLFSATQCTISNTKRNTVHWKLVCGKSIPLQDVNDLIMRFGVMSSDHIVSMVFMAN